MSIFQKLIPLEISDEEIRDQAYIYREMLSMINEIKYDRSNVIFNDIVMHNNIQFAIRESEGIGKLEEFDNLFVHVDHQDIITVYLDEEFSRTYAMRSILAAVALKRLFKPYLADDVAEWYVSKAEYHPTDESRRAWEQIVVYSQALTE